MMFLSAAGAARCQWSWETGLMTRAGLRAGERGSEPMLTIFSIPKPFVGHIGIIQRNAVQSWSCLRPRCEIILCSDEPGTKETAAEFEATYLPDVGRNEYGTPLLDSIFEQVQKKAAHRLICYVNADIILMSDLLRAAERVARSKRVFVMLGQRWRADIREPLDFGPGWGERLRARLAQTGRLDSPCGSDYFVFPRGSVGSLPPFAVGRPFWDTWFIYRARKLGIPVIDASRVVTAIHQDHDYSHVPDRAGEAWQGPEADRNLELTGVTQARGNLFRILDATHILTSRGLFPALGYEYLLSRYQSHPILGPAARPLGRLLRAVCSRLPWQRQPMGFR